MNDTLGQRIRDTRLSANLTQAQLSEKVFISESYMALIESDKRNPSTEVIIKIAEVLGVSSDYLLFGGLKDSEMSLFSEWKKLVKGRSNDEIIAAHNIVKSFFHEIDNLIKK